MSRRYPRFEEFLAGLALNYADLAPIAQVPTTVGSDLFGIGLWEADWGGRFSGDVAGLYNLQRHRICLAPPGAFCGPNPQLWEQVVCHELIHSVDERCAGLFGALPGSLRPSLEATAVAGELKLCDVLNVPCRPVYDTAPILAGGTVSDHVLGRQLAIQLLQLAFPQEARPERVRATAEEVSYVG